MNIHTPGPWQFYADTPSTDPNWHIVTNENRTRVIANVHIDPENKTDTANARLIAAAPGLLQACKDYVAICRNSNPTIKDLKFIVEAINLAEGK